MGVFTYKTDADVFFVVKACHAITFSITSYRITGYNSTIDDKSYKTLLFVYALVNNCKI